MKYLIQILTVCTLTFFTNASLLSQSVKENQDRIEELSTKLNKLEGQKDNLDRQSELLKEDFALKAIALNTKFKAEQTQLKREKLMFTIIGSIFGLFGLVYIGRFWKNVSKKIETEVTKKVVGLVNDEQQKFIKLIKDQELEARLKQNSKILVITKGEKNREQLEKLFNDAGIKQVDYEMSNTYQQPDSDIDLIIFDDHNDTKKQHDLFRTYLDQLANSDKMFIFFGGRLDGAKHENLNFSNSKFTLYNHIITALKFRAFER